MYKLVQLIACCHRLLTTLCPALINMEAEILIYSAFTRCEKKCDLYIEIKFILF